MSETTKTYEVESADKYEEVKCFEDLSKHSIKVGKSYLTFDYRLHKVKLYYKNKSLTEICNQLNYDYGFGILCSGVYMYTEFKGNECYLTPKVDKTKMVQRVGIYMGNNKIEVNI